MSEEITVVDTDNLAQAGAGTEYSIEYEVWGDGRPSIVMLHDGLGSVAQWRTTPEAIADRLGVAVLAYNRPGHGNSKPVPEGPWPTLWLHHQAQLLGLLLRAWNLENPLLVGHSDGGSISLIYATGEGPGPSAADARCRGIVCLAAHSFVEPICTEAITALRADQSRIHTALGLYHAEPQAVFAAWSGVWLSEAFGRWDIRSMLGRIEVPTWIVQGDRDEYGSAAQLWTTDEAIGDNSGAILLSGVGHLIHHQEPDAVVDIVAAAWSRSAGSPGSSGSA